MNDVIHLVGLNHALSILGVKPVGANAENGKKFLFTLAFLLTVLLLVWSSRGIARLYSRGTGRERAGFWARQAIHLTGTLLAIIGLAFPLQRVITAMAGYLALLRGRLSASAIGS